MRGTLYIKPLRANLRYDTRVFLRMCPFCIFNMDGQSGTTRPCANGGKAPNWQGQVIQLQKKEVGFRILLLKVDIVDQQLWTDQTIGQVSIQIDRQLDLTKRCNRPITAFIMRKGQNIGELNLELQWQPTPISKNTAPLARNIMNGVPQSRNSQPVMNRSTSSYERREPDPRTKLPPLPTFNQNPQIIRNFNAQQMDKLLE